MFDLSPIHLILAITRQMPSARMRWMGERSNIDYSLSSVVGAARRRVVGRPDGKGVVRR